VNWCVSLRACSFSSWLMTRALFVLRKKYNWLVAGGWFVLREKYCWLVAHKPNEQGEYSLSWRVDPTIFFPDSATDDLRTNNFLRWVNLLTVKLSWLGDVLSCILSLYSVLIVANCNPKRLIKPDIWHFKKKSGYMGGSRLYPYNSLRATPRGSLN
jgi:hypothetical protein